MGIVKKRCLIVCAAPVTRGALERCEELADSFIIAADGGYLRCGELGLAPHLILGDFDSAPPPASTAETLVYPARKDDTDCMLAVKEGMGRGYTRFTLLGCTGGRLDHTLAAIQSLAYLTERGGSGWILDGQHALTILRGGESLTLPRRGDYLSVFSLGERATGVKLRGVAYPLTDAVLENSFPLGVSNRIQDERCEISASTGRLLIMIVDEVTDHA